MVPTLLFTTGLLSEATTPFSPLAYHKSIFIRDAALRYHIFTMIKGLKGLLFIKRDAVVCFPGFLAPKASRPPRTIWKTDAIRALNCLQKEKNKSLSGGS